MASRSPLPVAVVLLLGAHMAVPGSAPTAVGPSVDRAAASHAAASRVSVPLPDTVQGAHVFASREEVRVVFPPEKPGDWSLPREPCFNSSRAHRWNVTVSDARVGTRFITLTFDRFGGADCPAHTFASLEDVVEAGRAGISQPGMFLVLDSTAVMAGVEEGRVVLTLRDRQAIVDLFGLRPPVVGAWTRRAGEEQVSGVVPVTYLDPQIPEPDEAFREESRVLRWEWEASIRRLGRTLRRKYNGPPISVVELAVGDSVGPEVHEHYCIHDLCQVRFMEVSPAEWSVDDPGIARLSFREPPDLVAIAVHGAVPSSGVRIHGVSPGRTVLRVTGLTSPWDTIPSRPPMPETLEVEVVVTAVGGGGG